MQKIKDILFETNKNSADEFAEAFYKEKKERGINNRAYTEAYFTQEIGSNILPMDVIMSMQEVTDIQGVKAMYIQIIWQNLDKMKTDLTWEKNEQLRCIETLKKLVTQVKDYNKIVDAIGHCDIQEKVDIGQQIELLRDICEKNKGLFSAIIREKMEAYINKTEVTAELSKRLNYFKDMGIDTKEYIKRWIETFEGLIKFLRGRVKRVEYTQTYGVNGEEYENSLKNEYKDF